MDSDGERDRNDTLPEATGWPTITRETRPWTRWWWLGNAVGPGDLERELSRLQEVGIGGVEITPIYGVAGEEHRNLEFLSDEWLAALEHTAADAEGREMSVDFVPGTGWHFGDESVGYADSGWQIDAETFAIHAGERLDAQFRPDRVRTVVAYSGDQSIELTDRIDADGGLEWEAPDAADWHVVALVAEPGRKVKRAAPDSRGYMVNPFYPAAMRRYLRRFDAGFGEYDGPPLRATFHDSFEFDAEWSPVLADAFEEQCGYRLEEHLPALLDLDDAAGGVDEDHVSRVTADYRRVLSRLYAETIAEWRQWSHRHGWRARFQAHCAPGNVLDLYALGDIPETEFIGEKRNLLGSKMASSAAHVTGKQLTSAETATWLDEHFQASLADIKAHVDELFLAGVNHVVYHGTAYSPDDAPWPGWLFYASTQLNDRNPIWHDFDALNEYVTRCQSVLQFGDPGTDLLLYWPVEDVWHREDGLAERLPILTTEWFESYPFGSAARWLFENGYGIDYVSDRQLTDAVVQRGRIDLPGSDYRTVVVPKTDYMPVETLRKLLDLAAEGATVAFQQRLPDDVPGRHERDERRGQLSALLDGLSFTSTDDGIEEARRGDGRILVGDLEAIVPRTDAVREPLVDEPGLQFVRREFDGGTHYFVVNRGDDTFDGWLDLATDAASVVSLDPMTGEAAAAAQRDIEEGIEVRVQLHPDESVVLRTLSGDVDASTRQYWTAGDERTQLDGSWEIQFVRGGPERPPSVEIDELRSWTEFGDAHERFAGTARYRTTVDRPASGDRWWLDLGTVHESARVWLNGRELATRICPPYRIPIDASDLQPEANELVVEVTNLAANRIRDLDRGDADWQCFGDINFVDRDYEPFDASDWLVRPAGLLGPVRLVPRRSVDPFEE